jgi:hypothetical protein
MEELHRQAVADPTVRESREWLQEWLRAVAGVVALVQLDLRRVPLDISLEEMRWTTAAMHWAVDGDPAALSEASAALDRLRAALGLPPLEVAQEPEGAGVAAPEPPDPPPAP